MLLNRLAFGAHAPCSRLAYRTTIRSASTIVGQSGRIYRQGKILQHLQDPKRTIFKAESENESFVLKCVSRSCYDRSLRLAEEFAGSRRLRMHVDCNQEEGILVYPYFRNTLLALIKEDPELPFAERRKILQHVGEAIQELHAKDWIHIDIKPDNILANWTCNDDGTKTVTDAVLSDLDTTIQVKDGQILQTRYPAGNVMWRSPEGQTAHGLTKASDIYSFGLVCLYAFGAGDFLILNHYQELVKSGIPPEQEILTRHFCYFGPVSEGLLTQVYNEKWCRALKDISEEAEEIVKDNPELRFERWGEELGPEAVDMISGMTNMDPKARITIDQVLEHPFWKLEDTE